MRYTLMHISDLHAGPPFRQHVADLVAKKAHDLKPDLLVISGDFVQRADFKEQWAAIREYMGTLPQPLFTVPGNHDVPLFNPFKRIFRSLKTYQAEISQDLNPVFTKPGLAVVGGYTAHGLTVDGGYVSPRQQQALAQTFSQYGEDTCKIIVLHHHIIAPIERRTRRKIRNGPEVARLMDRCGVELMLCGHIHQGFIGHTRDAFPDLKHGTLIVQSGTTTSRRGGGLEHGMNSFNVIHITDKEFEIERYQYSMGSDAFKLAEERSVPRHSTTVMQVH